MRIENLQYSHYKFNDRPKVKMKVMLEDEDTELWISLTETESLQIKSILENIVTGRVQAKADVLLTEATRGFAFLEHQSDDTFPTYLKEQAE